MTKIEIKGKEITLAANIGAMWKMEFYRNEHPEMADNNVYQSLMLILSLMQGADRNGEYTLEDVEDLCSTMDDYTKLAESANEEFARFIGGQRKKDDVDDGKPKKA